MSRLKLISKIWFLQLRSVIRNNVGELLEKKKVVLGSSVEESQQIFEDLCKKENSLKLLKVDIDETVKVWMIININEIFKEI